MSCANNLKQLGLATINFADNNQEQIPPANGWFPYENGRKGSRASCTAPRWS